MTSREQREHQHFQSINDRNFSAVFNDIRVPNGYIAGYAIIGVVGRRSVFYMKNIRTLDRLAVSRLTSNEFKVWGKTGITTCDRISDRALTVVGAITRGKKRVSSYVDTIYSHLAENPKDEAMHMIFGICCRPGQRETDEVVIEADIARDIMTPLNVEVLNLPGRAGSTMKYNRQKIDMDLKLVLPDRIIK